MTDVRDGAQPRHGGLPLSVAAIVLACIIATMGTLAATEAASPSPNIDADGGGQTRLTSGVVATGPFGSMEGLSVETDPSLPDPALLETLDAYGRGAQIRLTPAAGAFRQWRATAYREPEADPTAAIELAAGGADISAPFRLGSSGLFLVRLDGSVVDPTTTDPGTAGSWVWRIAVPDRDVPGGGDPYPPMPAILMASGDQSIDLDPGSGCFVGTCGDIGATSPPRTLPTIRTLAGAPLDIRLSDGSGITAWSADATPVGATDDATVQLGSGSAKPAAHTLIIAAPQTGRWVIRIHLRFDRDRGTTDGYGRLILQP